jgi:hypothetical protein
MVDGRIVLISWRMRSLEEVEAEAEAEAVVGEVVEGRNTVLPSSKLGSQKCVARMPSRRRPLRHRMTQCTRMVRQVV